MRSVFRSLIAVLILNISWALPAQADLTAAQVRDALFGYYEAFGYQISSSSEEYVGDTLTIKDLGLSIKIPDEDVTVLITISQFALKENSDGSVDFILPDVLPMTVDILDDESPQARIDLEMASTDLTGRVSGELDNLRIEASASTTSVQIVNIDVEGELFPATVILATGPFSSDQTIRLIEDDKRDISGEYSVETIDITANASDPDGNGFFSMTASIASMVSDFAATAKPTKDPMEFLSAGFSVDGTVTIGASDLDVNFRDGNDRFAMTSASDSGFFGFRLSKDEIAYDIRQSGVDMNISGSEIPLPAIKLNYEEFGVAFDIPLSQGDGPRDFRLSTTLKDFEMAEAIWSIFDPTQQLPRDPATFVIDITGKVLVLIDLLDPENLEAIDDMDGPPMLPVSADLNELMVSAAGAFLTGNGSATVDFTNPNMVAGFPAPEGKFTVQLKGGFGLMDKLVAMGLMPENASMGVRAMLGAFSKPIGEDHLESVIELGADGSIKANGQRIQ